MSDGEAVVVQPRWAPVGDAGVRRLFCVGFDPGEATGWAVLRLDLDKLVKLGFAELVLRGGPDAVAWSAGEFRASENTMADQMVGLLRGVWMDGEFGEGELSDVLAVSVEDFILRMLSTDRNLLSPVRVTAAFNYARREVPIPVTRFSASDAKRVVTDERMKALNLWMEGSDHPRDALRQAILLARNMVEEPFRTRWCGACPWLREA